MFSIFRCDANHYQIEYILSLSKQKRNRKVLGEETDLDVEMADDDDILLQKEN